MISPRRLGTYKSFFVSAILICLGGFVIMGAFTAFFAWADVSVAQKAPAVATVVRDSSYNVAGSYGITGMPQLKITPTADTPSFIADPLKERRGIVLLVYCRGAVADRQMVTFFNQVKAEYAGESSFFAFAARDVNALGDVLAQLHAYNPPMLAVIDGQGRVRSLYTGWIDEKTLEQRVADAVNTF
jgi:hypothetical protein